MNIKITLALLLFIFSNVVSAQSDLPQDYLNSEFHQARREALRKSMPENSVAIFFANPVRNRANDVNFVYHQDPNFHYLTGLNDPHSVLVIFSEDQEEEGHTFNETVYIYERSARYKRYMGEGTGVKGAREKLGLTHVYPAQDFIDKPIDFSKFDKIMFREIGTDVRKSGREQPNLYALIEQFKTSINTIPMPKDKEIDSRTSELVTVVDNKTLRTLMATLREVKSEEELKLIKKAILAGLRRSF